MEWRVFPRLSAHMPFSNENGAVSKKFKLLRKETFPQRKIRGGPGNVSKHRKLVGGGRQMRTAEARTANESGAYLRSPTGLDIFRLGRKRGSDHKPMLCRTGQA